MPEPVMQTPSHMPVIDLLSEAVTAGLVSEGLPEDSVQEIRWDRPRRVDHGDLSTNAAMMHAKLLELDGRDLAQRLSAHIAASDIPHFADVSVAGPGFVNIHLEPTWLHDLLARILMPDGVDFARADIGHGQAVSIEFVSANPTGPLHAGGGRWAATATVWLASSVTAAIALAPSIMSMTPADSCICSGCL